MMEINKPKLAMSHTLISRKENEMVDVDAA